MSELLRSRIRHLVLGAGGLLFAIGAALMAASFLSLEHMPPLNELPMIPTRHGNVVRKLRWLSVSIGILAIAVLHPAVTTFSAKSWIRLLVAGRTAIRSAVADLQSISLPHWLALAVVTVAGAGLRLVFLNRPLLWDEGLTLFDFVLRPWWVAPTWYPAPNNHVLNSELAWLTTNVMSPTLWAFRLPAFVAGTLQIPATWMLARKLHDDRVAFVAAALVAVSSVLVAQSVEARGYSIVGLCFLGLLCLAADLRSRDNLALWFVFTALATVGAYTIPTMLFPLAFVCAWLLLCTLSGDHVLGPRALLARLVTVGIGIGVSTLILYLPIIVVTGFGALFFNRFVSPLSIENLFGAITRQAVTTGIDWTANLSVTAYLLLAVSLALGLMVHRPGHRVPLLAGLIGPAAVMLVQRVVPFSRVWSFIQPVVLITAALGLVWAIDRIASGSRRLNSFLTTVVIGSLVISMVVGVTRAEFLISSEWESATMPHGPGVAEFLANELRDGDAIITVFPSTQVVRYQLRKRGLEHYLTQPPEHPVREFVIVNSYHGPSTLEDVLAAEGDVPTATRVFVEGQVEVFRIENP